MKMLYRSCLATLLACASVAPAHSEIFVQWPDVEGDSKQKGYEKHIEISAVSGNFQLNNCGGFYIEKALDSSSAELMQMAFMGKRTIEVTIRLTNEGSDGPVPYLTIVLSNVTVHDVSTSAVDGDRPVEDVSLGAEKVVFQKYSTNASGKVDLTNPVKTSIDCSGSRR